MAVPFAVSKKLMERARIRHDWAAMYIALKGDDKEYYVDIKVIHLYTSSIYYFVDKILAYFLKKISCTVGYFRYVSNFEIIIQEFEMLFEDFGGFDGLYMKMLACGIPTAVHLMWIPLSELDFRQQFLLTVRLSHQCFNALWKTTVVTYARDWVLQKFRNINDDIMMTILFPIVELILPYYVCC